MAGIEGKIARQNDAPGRIERRGLKREPECGQNGGSLLGV
jgi:hypothetical protein